MRVPTALIVLVLLLPTAAAASPAEDAAVAASEAMEAHCSDAWSGKTKLRSDSLKRVADVWGQVADAHESGTDDEKGWLLYWRGALAQCLGQFEAARDDLKAFVEAQEGSDLYADQVKRARLYLKRAGVMLDAGSGGRSANWLREPDAIELRVGYGGGLGWYHAACTDLGTRDSGRVDNSNCEGGHDPRSADAVLGAPVLVDVELDAWLHTAVGFGGRLRVLWNLPVAFYDRVDNGPVLQAAAGPSFRIGARDTGLRAALLRVEPRFGLAFSDVSPLAGDKRFYDTAQPAYDGGAWRVYGLGFDLDARLQVEMGTKAVLELGGRVGIYGPADGSLLVKRRGAEAAVVKPVEPLEGGRFQAGFRVSALGVPTKGSHVALGPFVDLGTTMQTLTFPDDPADTWEVEVDGVEQPYKVFSTRRVQFVVRLGIQLELGAGRAPGAKVDAAEPFDPSMPAEE